MANTDLNVYLEASLNQTWYSVVAHNPLSDASVKLCTEKDYPVEVIYRKIDCNGDNSYSSFVCCDRGDLIQALDWLGDCYFTPCRVWDFDIDKDIEPALHKLFNDAYDRRLEQIQKAADEIYVDAEELPDEEVISISKAEMDEMASRADERLKEDAKAAFQSLDAQIELASARASKPTTDTHTNEISKKPSRPLF